MRSWAAVAISAGVGAALSLQHHAALVDPVACPGLFDLLAVIAARTWRDMPLGSMLGFGNAIALFVSLVLFSRAVNALTRSTPVTIATTLAAAGSSVVFAPALAPSGAIVLAVTTASVSAAARSFETGAGRWRALGLLALLVATVPPTGPGCIVPAGGWSSVSVAGDLLVNAALEAGLLAMTLSMLGLTTITMWPRAIAWFLPALIFLSFWGLMTMPGRPEWMRAPFTLAFWLTVAAGLAEVWKVLHRSPGGKIGALTLSAALVVLQVVGANPRRSTDPAPEGHDRMTLSMMSAVVGQLPAGAGLVVEDASISLLSRALPRRMRPPDRFHFVSRDGQEVARELNSSRVFALPLAQRTMMTEGFELVASDAAGISGLAEVRPGPPCSDVLDAGASIVPQIEGQLRFAIAAKDENSRGPVVILLPADAPLSATPVGWPTEATRGFHARTFDLSVGADATSLSEELRGYQLSEAPPPAARYLTRIEAWRTPGAPLALSILLGGPSQTVTAKLLGPSNQQLRLCPLVRFEIRPLAIIRP